MNDLQGVASLLDLLDLDSSGLLINIPPEERRRVLVQLDSSAKKFSFPGPEGLYSRLLQLGEEVLEPQGRMADAAVLYALAQDDCLEENDDLAGLMILFRFKLGHVFRLLDPENDTQLRRSIDFALRSIDLLQKLRREGDVTRDVSRALMCKLQKWLGFRYGQLGEQKLALDSCLGAWAEADDPCDRVNCVLEAVRIYGQRGEDQRAYQWLLQCRDDLELVEDDEVRQTWEMQIGFLQMKLGGQLLPLSRSFKTPVARGFGEIVGQGLTAEALPDPRQADSLVSMLPLPDEEDHPDLRHARLIAQTLTAFALKEPDRARALLNEAERLESRLIGSALEKGRFQREVLLARWEMHSGDAAEAVRLFAALLPEAEARLDVNDRITFLAHLLEAMAKEPWPDIQDIRERSTQLLALFEDLMERQPGGAARRRVRDLEQHSLESALFALCTAAERWGFGQEMLTRAWHLIMTTRNPELRTVSSDVGTGGTDENIHDLEKEFHAKLRDQLADVPKRPAPWEKPLDRLQEYEIAVARAPRHRDNTVVAPPSQGVSLTFFRFRDLFRSKPMLVLISLRGYLRCLWVPESVRELEEDEFPIWSWLPEDLVEITRNPGKNPLPWSFFPDAELHETRVEMVSFSEEAEVYLGETVPVRLCLRSSASDVEERVDLSRGWIGLGGVPSLGIFIELEGSSKEVAQVEALLASQEVPTALLMGGEATSGRLAYCLNKMRPAMVHIAVHGHYEEDHPEACALILAPDPEQGGYELLPFRHILDLPLRGVELVILSACSSLLGPSRRSAGMEGLAWAFLQAGARQVIATRDEANDEVASVIMGALYRHLLEYPVAEALRRTRRECLRDLEIDPQAVSLWSVWS